MKFSDFIRKRWKFFLIFVIFLNIIQFSGTLIPFIEIPYFNTLLISLSFSLIMLATYWFGNKITFYLYLLGFGTFLVIGTLFPIIGIFVFGLSDMTVLTERISDLFVSYLEFFIVFPLALIWIFNKIRNRISFLAYPISIFILTILRISIGIVYCNLGGACYFTPANFHRILEIVFVSLFAILLDRTLSNRFIESKK